MHDMWMAFRECGWASWLCLLIGFGGIAAGFVGVVLLATKARGAAWIVGSIAVMLGFGAIGVGVLGRQMGLARMEEALEGDGIDPSQKATIRAIGTEEAGQCVKVGVGTGALPFLLGALAVGV